MFRRFALDGGSVTAVRTADKEDKRKRGREAEKERREGGLGQRKVGRERQPGTHGLYPGRQPIRGREGKERANESYRKGRGRHRRRELRQAVQALKGWRKDVYKAEEGKRVQSRPQ